MGNRCATQAASRIFEMNSGRFRERSIKFEISNFSCSQISAQNFYLLDRKRLERGCCIRNCRPHFRM